MTTKILSTYAAAGYTLAASVTELDITTTGGVGGAGVYSNHFATISNAGKINETTGSSGVYLGAGGVVINQKTGTIAGYNAIYDRSATPLTVENYGTITATKYAMFSYIGGSLTNGSYASRGATISGQQVALGLRGGAANVTNLGTISASVILGGGGSVVNGGLEDTTALIDLGGGVAIGGFALSTVANYGTITGNGGHGFTGVYLGAGGRVTNGAVTDTAARIEGTTGVHTGSGQVTNFGTIDGTGVGVGNYGVLLTGAGSLTNGGGADAGALVEGYTGVVATKMAATVTNLGTIAGLGLGASAGVLLDFGGTVTNGMVGLIEGGAGVSLATGGLVQNNGTIRGESNAGYSGAGVLLSHGGVVNNGTASDRAALITGDYGIFSKGAAATIRNLGTISGDYHSAGVELYAGGALTNGSARDSVALISGYDGVKLLGVASVANFGTISGVGGYGVYLLGSGESVTNGAAGHAGALIEGYTGVDAYGGGVTVTNFGTIAGEGGSAVTFGAGGDVLVVEAGCAFVGRVFGGGGTLDLASGVGTISNFASGNVTVSGSMATTTFQSFFTVEVGAGATFADTGAVTIAAGQTVNAAGTLTLGGAGKASIVNAGLIETTGTGTLTLAGAVTGSGTAKIGGGTLFSASTFNEAVTFTGTTGLLELAKSQTYTAAIRGFSKTGGTSLDLNDIAFGGSTKATYSGTATSGTLTVTDGIHTAHILLIGDYRTSTFTASSDGLGGTIVVDPRAKIGAAIPQGPSPHPLVAAMAALGAPAGITARAIDSLPAREPLIARPHVMTA